MNVIHLYIDSVFCSVLFCCVVGLLQLLCTVLYYLISNLHHNKLEYLCYFLLMLELI